MAARADAKPGVPRGTAAAGPVVVLGTAALDHVIRLAEPLSPGRKIAGEDRGLRLGGGGANASVALARAGRAVRLAATLGTGPDGDLLLAMLERSGVDTSLVRRVPGASPRALVLVDPAGERTVVRLGAPDPAPLPAIRGAEAVSCLFVRGDAPGLAPLMTGMAPSSTIVAQIPPCEPGSRPSHLLVGSEGDLDAAFLADPFAAGRRVAGDLLRWVVVTRGGAGATAYGAQGRSVTVPAGRVPVVDSTGAGDLFAAGLIHALLGGRTMDRALRTAAAWGAAAVGHEGGLPGENFPPPDRA